MHQLVLASSSPFRRKVLEDAGFTLRCVEPPVDESVFNALDPQTRALEIALAKAASVPMLSGEVGVAADQVVYDTERGVIFGKPKTDEEQVERLMRLVGRSHELMTGWVVYGQDWQLSGVETSRVTFRDVTEAEVRAYVKTGEARGCAGGYAVEGMGSFLIASVDGDWFNVIGLPIYRIHGALREKGWRFGR